MILIIDNHDSFTYNLVQLCARLGADVVVRLSDELDVDDVAALAPDGIILSPGPGDPGSAGVTVGVVTRLGGETPILGVCLGHQAIGVAYGARVVRAQRPMHGKVSSIAHTGDGLFRGIPDPVGMTRYHSLTLAPDSMPADLEVVAWTEDDNGGFEVQGVRHRNHPVFGVQFHPESVASSHGDRLVANFMEMAT